MLRRNWQASKESENASVLSAKDTRELIVLAVGGTYLQTLATAARVDSQRAQVENAQAICQQALVRKQAGTNAKIDVMRSLVELQTEQQRLSSLQADFRKQKISLARILGLSLEHEVILSEPLSSTGTAPPDAPAAVQLAFTHRADLQASEAQLRAAEKVVSAAHGEPLPSVSVNGDYGALGPNPTSAHGVFAVTGSVNIPVWQGGRVKGDILQAESTLRQRQAELVDARTAVEQEVRNALIELETAAGQVKLATSNREYASETLVEARDRFTAGVATTVEVVQAQEQVASAESDYISGLFSFDLARLDSGPSHRRGRSGYTRFVEGKSPMSATTAEQAPPAKKANSKGRNKAFLIFFAILLVLAAVGLLYWLHARQFESTDDAQVDAHLNPISARVDGTITHVYTDDNQVVHAGDPLVDLDPQRLQVALTQALAQLHAGAQHGDRQSSRTFRSHRWRTPPTFLPDEADVANAQAALAAAERDREANAAKLAEAEANNATRAGRSGALPDTDLERRGLAAGVRPDCGHCKSAGGYGGGESRLLCIPRIELSIKGKAQLDAGAEPAESIPQQRTAAGCHPRAPRCSPTRQALKVRRHKLEQAKLKLSYSKIVAPVAGIVMKRSAEVGAHISAGQQLLQIAQIGDLWVTANFKETQLRSIHPGQMRRSSTSTR